MTNAEQGVVGFAAIVAALLTIVVTSLLDAYDHRQRKDQP